jgi:hypothetical protein
MQSADHPFYLSPETSFNINFPGGEIAKAIFASSYQVLPLVVEQLNLQNCHPALVLVGGAAGLRHYHFAKLHHIFTKVLAPIAQSLNASVIDGGTDSGIMQLMGRTRHQIQGSFPLIGVAPVGKITFPDHPVPPADATALEAHHTHFVLVPEAQPGAGSQWGDESAWIAQIASLLTLKTASIAIVINGGEITWQDTLQNIQVGRTVIAINGTGRAADAMALALQGNAIDARAEKIAASGLLQVIDLENAEGLAKVITQTLSKRG